MRKLNVRLIIYLDDILLLAHSTRELCVGKDTLIFLIQNPGFLTTVKKSQYQQTQKLQFFGVEIDSVEMSLSLPSEKVLKIITQC